MKVPIEIFCTAQTKVNETEVRRWLRYIGAENFDPPDGISDPALLVALAGKRCYMSFEVGLNPNLTRIREDYVQYFDNILSSGHGSVLEHSVFTFAIEGVSRVFTAEMNRHRAGWAISEGSLRFIKFGDDVPYWEPDSIQGPDVESSALCGRDFLSGEFRLGDAPTLDQKKHVTRLVMAEAYEQTAELYSFLVDLWKDELAPSSKFGGKKQITSMMRRIVPLGVATGGVWTGNVRALRHVMTMRAAPEAEEEMIHVFSRIAKLMRDTQPLLFGDFEQVDGHWKPKYKKV